MGTMKAIICPKYGPADVLQIRQINKPIHRQDEVLIKIYATSVTNSDLFIRSSNIPSKMMRIPFRLMMGLRGPRNPIIGEVFSGRIEAVGFDIKRFKPGDKVYGLTGFSLGGYADYKCMKEVDSKQGCLAIMPDNISYEEATSAAYGGLLAIQYMEKGNIKKDNKVLIYGASGTTGTFAVQYAKHLGATVTAVCGTKNLEFIKSLGADNVVDYTRQDAISQLVKYDFVLDAVGKSKTSALKKACVKALSKNGKYGSIDESPLLLKSDRLNQITKMVEAGAVNPVNDRVYSFEQIIEAHKYVETGHKRGNVAVTVNFDQ
ncbi:NADPH:quinone reductase [Anoxynatronum buryatiense]|uniref:NADPH:quinone reductase n=2 Tax=Anoxynatronum buryatiense TaxID=489973 RepID=A0AA45WWH1_9CLOT|nr:NADPH:quinone reductase [Anoxynatronum buryatiense]